MLRRLDRRREAFLRVQGEARRLDERSSKADRLRRRAWKKEHVFDLLPRGVVHRRSR